MINLRTMSVDDLKDVAREYSIAGAWKMKKDALIESILKNAEANGQSDKYCDEGVETSESENAETTEKTPRGKLIEYNGKSQTLGKWAEELGFTTQTLYARIYISKWPVDKAFETPSKRKAKEENA